MKISENTVAICMATYNGEKYLQQQLDSILNQSVQDWVLFIRDDHSTDETPYIIERYCSAHKEKIILIDDPTLVGGSAKNNFAAIMFWVGQHYNFPYYMFADQDDFWLENKIEKTLHMMQQNEGDKTTPLLVHTDLKVVDQNLQVMGDSFLVLCQ